jgi:hypothetical protein
MQSLQIAEINRVTAAASQKNSLKMVALLTLWSAAVIGGMGAMVRYQMTPASIAPPAPPQWPANARITRATDRPTLVMALHPACPCSRASISELSALLARVPQQRLAVRVLVVHPSGAPAEWDDSDLVRSARAVPGVTVSIDDGGADVAAFGATTSGQVALYDAQGRALFSGGITDGRGHEGDNPGLDAVLAALGEPNAIPAQNPPAMHTTPVFGCPLMGHQPSSKDSCSGYPGKTGKESS